MDKIKDNSEELVIRRNLKQQYFNKKLISVKLAKNAIAKEAVLKAKERYTTIDPFRRIDISEMPNVVTNVPFYDTSLIIGKNK